jgi:hypothetical protein
MTTATLDPLGQSYKPSAVYFLDSDCVEYVKEDAFCIYDRIDSFLTLILDETQRNVVGFKLKGFKHVFDRHIKPRHPELQNCEFIDLVSMIETAFTDLGNQVFSIEEDERERAYMAARKLAANDNVKLAAAVLKKAA